MGFTTPAAAVRAAVSVAAGLGIPGTDPVILADGANVIVHLSRSPVVAKVAASTAAIRADPAASLQRELDVVRFLVRQGAPVMPPSAEVPATTYRGDGHVMSFWTYLPPGGDADAGVLAGALRRLTAELAAVAGEGQVLHGDAGAGNLMATAAGWVWHDFEDMCTGPAAWDLAPSVASRFMDGAQVLAAYGEAVDPRQLDICRQLRLLNLTIWYSVYAERLPECRERAAELVAGWRAPQLA